MTDWVQVDGLVVNAAVGVYAWEKRAPRPLVVDIRLLMDLRAAGASDALEDTVDYAAVTAAAAEVAAARHHKLLETYADQLARCLFQRFACAALAITVHKPGAVARTRNLSVHIERERDDYDI